MHRLLNVPLAACAVALLVVGHAVAQEQEGARSHDERLESGVEKIEYIGRQLLLSDEQQAKYDRLTTEVYEAEFKAALANESDRLDEMRTLAKQIQEARRNKDLETYNRLQEEIRLLSPGNRARAKFFEALNPMLSAEQKELLEDALERLERNPSGELMAVDLIRAARRTGLSAEQEQQLAKIRDECRQRIRNEIAPADTMARNQIIARMSDSVRAILTEAQAAKYDRLVAGLKMSQAAATDVQPAEPTSAGDAEGSEDAEK